MKSNPFGRLRALLVRALVASARLLPEERESIWSVPRQFQAIYFLVFIGICIPMIMHIVDEELRDQPGAGIVALATESASRFATVGAGAAIGTLLIVQGGYLIMMAIYHILTNRFAKPVIEQHREEGRREGRQEGDEAWRRWLAMREERESQGMPFDEPPPDQQQNGHGRRSSQ